MLLAFRGKRGQRSWAFLCQRQSQSHCQGPPLMFQNYVYLKLLPDPSLIIVYIPFSLTVVTLSISDFEALFLADQNDQLVKDNTYLLTYSTAVENPQSASRQCDLSWVLLALQYWLPLCRSSADQCRLTLVCLCFVDPEKVPIGWGDVLPVPDDAGNDPLDEVFWLLFYH